MVQTRSMATHEAKAHGYEFGGPYVNVAFTVYILKMHTLTSVVS